MLKFAVPLGLILILPAVSAGFVSSDLELSVDSPSAIPLNDAVNINGKINFSWGFGAVVPIPLSIYIETENVPDWLSVSIQPSSFTITPVGWRGGSIEKDIKITLRAKEEAPAFVTYNVVIHAYTNGSLLINGAEAREGLNVMQDFHDAGIYVEAENVKMKLHDSVESILNITNNCNAPIYVDISLANESKYFEISTQATQLIPSHSTKPIKMSITAKKIGKETLPLKITYYPVGHEEKKNFAYVNITAESYGEGTSLKAISIGIIIIIIASIIAVVVKKKR